MQHEVLALEKPKPQPLSSMEEADAEEELGSWLEGIGVNNAWKLAPTLVAAGWRRADVACREQVTLGENGQIGGHWSLPDQGSPSVTDPAPESPVPPGPWCLRGSGEDVAPSAPWRGERPRSLPVGITGCNAVFSLADHDPAGR